MKNIFVFIFLVFSIKCFSQYHFINDESNTLSNVDKEKIENLLSSYEKSTSIEIGVNIVNSTNGQNIETFARNVGNSWGIGKKELNNGIIFVVAIEDRKWKIIIGQGLKPFISGDYAQKLGEKTLTPYFRAIEYNAGIYQYLVNIIDILGRDDWNTRMKNLEIVRMNEEIKHQESKEEIIFIVGLFFKCLILTSIIIIISYIFYLKIYKKRVLKKELFKKYNEKINHCFNDLLTPKEKSILKNLQIKLSVLKDEKYKDYSPLWEDIELATSYISIKYYKTGNNIFDLNYKFHIHDANKLYDFIKNNCPKNIIEKAEEYISYIKEPKTKELAEEFFLKENFKKAYLNINTFYQASLQIQKNHLLLQELKSKWTNAKKYVETNLSKFPKQKQIEIMKKSKSMNIENHAYNITDMILLQQIIENETHSISAERPINIGGGGKFGGGGASSTWTEDSKSKNDSHDSHKFNSDSDSNSGFSSSNFGGGGFSGGDSGGGSW